MTCILVKHSSAEEPGIHIETEGYRSHGDCIWGKAPFNQALTLSQPLNPLPHKKIYWPSRKVQIIKHCSD